MSNNIDLKLNKHIFESKDVMSNIMNNEVLHVIDSSSCDELQNAYLKNHPSVIHKERMSFVKQCSSEKGSSEQRSNLAKMTNYQQKNLNTHSRTRLKGNEQIYFNKKENVSQCQSLNLTRKRTADHPSFDSELNMYSPNKLKKKDFSNTNSNCKYLDNQTDKDFMFIEEHSYSTTVQERSTHLSPNNHTENHIPKPTNNPMSERPQVHFTAESGLNINCPNQEDVRKEYSSKLNSLPLIEDTSYFGETQEAISTNKLLNMFKKICNNSLNRTILNSSNSSIKNIGNRAILNEEEFVQPLHIMFPPPKNIDLCKMRKLQDYSMSAYNCYRSEFTVEYDNEAEEILSVAGQLNDLRISQNTTKINNGSFNRIKSKFQDKELFQELEIAIIESYEARLQERERRKRVVKEFGLINQRAADMWRYKLETTIGKDEVKNLIRFFQFQNFEEAGILLASFQLMYEKRTEINKMIYYRSHYGVSTKKDISIVDSLKPKLDQKIKRADIHKISIIPPTIEVCPKTRKKRTMVELFGMPRYKELTIKEAEFCTNVRLTPEFFLDAKATMISECKKSSGILLKKARKLFRIDVNKTRRMFDYLLEQGFIWIPETGQN